MGCSGREKLQSTSKSSKSRSLKITGAVPQVRSFTEFRPSTGNHFGELSRRLKFIQYRTGAGNAIGAFLQTPAPVLDKISGPMGAQFLSSAGLGSGNLIGRAQIPPAPALDKNRSLTLWYSLVFPVLVFTGASPRRVSTKSGGRNESPRETHGNLGIPKFALVKILKCGRSKSRQLSVNSPAFLES